MKSAQSLFHRLGKRITVLVWLLTLTGGFCIGQDDRSKVVRAVESWLQAPDRQLLEEQPFADFPLSGMEAENIQRLLWKDHRQPGDQDRHDEWKNKAIRLDDLEMKFDYRVFGDPPPEGRSLFISMHGGGNAPARVNDQQWSNQIRLYRPAEGIYLAPRAPTDSWNMWHQSHIDRFFERLIQDAVAFENVNPNRVYLMGYSAGGDGVYQLAPRMADYLAAAAMMAGHPNDASPLGLRNIGFAIHVGGRDDAFRRNEVARQWKKRLDELQHVDPQGYRHKVVIHEQRGHWLNRQDAGAIDWMSQFTRQPRPHKVVWHQSQVVHDQFYWLAVDRRLARPGSTLAVRREGQNFVVESAENVDQFALLLNDQIVDLDQSITVRFGDRVICREKVNRTTRSLVDSIRRRQDPELVFSARLPIEIGETEKDHARQDHARQEDAVR